MSEKTYNPDQNGNESSNRIIDIKINEKFEVENMQFEVENIVNPQKINSGNPRIISAMNKGVVVSLLQHTLNDELHHLISFNNELLIGDISIKLIGVDQEGTTARFEITINKSESDQVEP